jgi:hypothetical protein
MRIRMFRGRWAALIAVGGLAVALAYPVNAAAGDSLPFTDPNAVGFISLCDHNGQSITSGKLTDFPFVWTAVSSTPAPLGYEKGKATLYAFQPRQEVDPGEWSGLQLSGSSTYTNPAHPVVQETYGDLPLDAFTGSYPPQWSGLVQLRIYYTGINLEQHAAPYPATVLRVKGDRWTLVTGGTVPCNSGHGTSNEGPITKQYVQQHATTTIGSAALTTEPPGSQASTSGLHSSTHGSDSSTTTTSGTSGSSSAARGDTVGGQLARTASGPLPIGSGGGLSAATAALIAVVAAILVGGAGGLYWRRRRRA